MSTPPDLAKDGRHFLKAADRLTLAPELHRRLLGWHSGQRRGHEQPIAFVHAREKTRRSSRGERQAREHGQGRSGQREHRLTQREVHERAVRPDQATRQRIAKFRIHPTDEQPVAQRRSKRQRDQRGRSDHQRLGQRQWTKQPACFTSERKNRQKAPVP